MALQIDRDRARTILIEEARRVEKETSSSSWDELVERVSQACEVGAKSHIAFLGTAILAKATNLKVDAFAIKVSAGTAGAHDARALVEQVLVPEAISLGISLGVNGPQPLNNQPYFRSHRISRDTVVRSKKRLGVLCDALERVERIRSEGDARAALRAFIKVRRRYQRPYATAPKTEQLSLDQLVQMIGRFVTSKSDGGRRAQASVAGLISLIAGAENVDAGHVNDPDRHFPGDVGMRAQNSDKYICVIEVRDKVVQESDLLLFARKAAGAGVSKAGFVAVARSQKRIPLESVLSWATSQGVDYTIFWSWEELTRQALFWSPYVSSTAITKADALIRERLIAVEVPHTSLAEWDSSPHRPPAAPSA